MSPEKLIVIIRDTSPFFEKLIAHHLFKILTAKTSLSSGRITLNMNEHAPTSISDRLIFVWLFIFFLVLLWSGISPHDRFTWILEVFPAILGLGILITTYKQFQFTKLAYWLMLVHAIILMIGGHYTYAEVPLFNWIRDTFNLGRNHYDKVGHFAQGFVPAIIAREILIRKSPVKQGRWLSFTVICISLALSASYEFFEWWVSEITGTAAEAFLGTQGYVWDTQSDMFMALLGAITALSLLSRAHDRALSLDYK